MKIKKLTPRNVAPVQRENTATISRDGNAIAPGGWLVHGILISFSIFSYAQKNQRIKKNVAKSRI